MVLSQNDLSFPPPETAAPDGLLAIGGDLQPQRLLAAYRSGIFPWYNPGEIIQWWSPDPRFVLFPQHLRVSKSMQQVMRQNQFEFRTNAAFADVMRSCMQTNRRGQDGTWISDELIDAYTTLHTMGVAHCAEAWQNGELVGGLYGIKLEGIFFGESMFSLKPNASKFAFIRYVQQLMLEGIQIIDCQIYTSHLESLGAEMISRSAFKTYLPAFRKT